MISSALWISSNEARAFRLTPDKVENHHFHRHGPHRHPVEHGKNHPVSEDSNRFFHEVADALMKNGNDRFLLVGPGPAKLHFKDWVAKHLPKAAERIIGVEPMDKATDGEIVDFAHRYFRKVDKFEAI